MNDKIASSKALGFGVFAVTVWMFSMIDAGWFAPAMYGSSTGHVVAVFSMIGLLIAAIAAFMRGETWFAFFFMFWAAVSWGYSGVMAAGPGMAPAYSGWLWIAFALVTLYLWLAAMRGGLGGAISFTVLLWGLSAVASGLQGFFGGDVLHVIDGYLGLAAGLVAFYVSAAEIVNSQAGREILPFSSAGKSGGAAI